MAPKTTGTRPMSDKVRAALFTIIGEVDGAIVLDAYAGSGAVGFEALSRGAARVVAVESTRTAGVAIKANQKALGLTWGYELYQTTVEAWLARWTTRAAEMPAFDLIVADPPYDRLRPDVLGKLGSLLAPADGILVVSHGSRLEPPKLARLALINSKTYGDSALSFYKPA